MLSTFFCALYEGHSVHPGCGCLSCVQQCGLMDSHCSVVNPFAEHGVHAYLVLNLFVGAVGHLVYV